MAVHPGTGATLSRVQFHILVSESLPYLPFPSLQTHLRHLSSARPHPSKRRVGVGPRSLCGGLSLCFPWGISGLLAPLGAKSLLSPLCFPLLIHPWPQNISTWTTELTTCSWVSPTPRRWQGWFWYGSTYPLSFPSPTPSGRKLRPAGGQGTA